MREYEIRQGLALAERVATSPGYGDEEVRAFDAALLRAARQWRALRDSEWRARPAGAGKTLAEREAYRLIGEAQRIRSAYAMRLGVTFGGVFRPLGSSHE